MSKYAPLHHYLVRVKTNKLTLTFAEIEKIIGANLPRSAFNYPEWWGNDLTHTQAANGWLAAQWKKSDVNLLTKVVQFNRIGRTHKTDLFRLIGFDEGGLCEGPRGDLRLVCNTQGGQKIAIFGKAQGRSNIDTVLNAGMPCTVNCETRPPAKWAASQYGHTHWVPEWGLLRVVALADNVINQRMSSDVVD